MSFARGGRAPCEIVRRRRGHALWVLSNALFKRGRFIAFSHSVPLSPFIPACSRRFNFPVLPESMPGYFYRGQTGAIERERAQFVVARECKYRKWRANESLSPHEQA